MFHPTLSLIKNTLMRSTLIIGKISSLEKLSVKFQTMNRLIYGNEVLIIEEYNNLKRKPGETVQDFSASFNKV